MTCIRFVPTTSLVILLAGCTVQVSPNENMQPGDSETGNSPQPPATQTFVASTFETGDEGWRVRGGDFAAPTPPAWAPGLLTAQGTGPWWWLAPSKFHGDLSAAHGGRLVLDWDYTLTSGNLVNVPVLLSGGGLTLEWRSLVELRNDNTCRSVSARLDASETWFDVSTGDRATEEQFQAVLEDLTSLQISGPDGVGGSSLCSVRIVE